MRIMYYWQLLPQCCQVSLVRPRFLLTCVHQGCSFPALPLYGCPSSQRMMVHNLYDLMPSTVKFRPISCRFLLRYAMSGFLLKCNFHQVSLRRRCMALSLTHTDGASRHSAFDGTSDAAELWPHTHRDGCGTFLKLVEPKQGGNTFALGVLCIVPGQWRRNEAAGRNLHER